MVTVLTELSGARLGESDVRAGPESELRHMTVASAEKRFPSPSKAIPVILPNGVARLLTTPNVEITSMILVAGLYRHRCDEST